MDANFTSSRTPYKISMSGMPPVNQGGLGGNKISASQMLSGGMPCKFELLMEFFCSFFFTFIIYLFSFRNLYQIIYVVL